MPESTQDREQQSVILSKKGEPFKTEQSAKLVLASKKLEETHEVVPYDSGGYAIAKKSPKEEEDWDAEDPADDEVPEEMYVVCERCGHKNQYAEKGHKCTQCTGSYGENPALLQEEYYRVKFGAKSNQMEEDDVTLSVNGEQLIMQRDVEVILPARYIEVARHGVRPVFKQMPNEDRKVLSPVATFPFTLLGKATKAEFREMYISGNAIQQQRLIHDRAAAHR